MHASDGDPVNSHSLSVHECNHLNLLATNVPFTRDQSLYRVLRCIWALWETLVSLF